MHHLAPPPRRLASWLLTACATLAVSGAGCSKSSPPATAPPVADGPGEPKPPFAAEAPPNPMVVSNAETGRYGGLLVVASAGNPKTFNPILANEASSGEILHGPVYSTCWGYDHARQVEEPALCESFERSEDGLTYTFTLREGLRWSDGKPLTADDFEFNYRLITDPSVITSVTDLFKQGVDAEGKPLFPSFEKLDARRFRFKLHQQDVLFHVNVGSLFVVPRHRWETAYLAGDFNQTMRLNEEPANMVVSGPYRIIESVSDERVKLERNPHYWKVDKKGNRLPYIDQVLFVIVPDYNVMFLKFRDGETDMIEVRPEHYDPLKRVEDSKDYRIVDLGASFNTNYLMFNLDTRQDKSGKPFVSETKQRWFQSKVFRKAISHAIDRDGIVRTVMAGRGEPLWSYLSPSNKEWYNPDVIQYAYDLDKARELLSQEGFKLNGDALVDANGVKVEFSVTTNTENPTRIGMLNVIKDDLSKLGMTVHIRPVPFNDLVTMIRTSRNFDAILLGWGSAVPPDPAQSKNVLLSSGVSHFWHPDQPTPATEWEKEMDRLLYAATSTFDLEARKKHTAALLHLFSDWQPQIQLVVQRAYAAGRKNLGNFEPAGLRPTLTWNVDRLYFKTPKPRR